MSPSLRVRGLDVELSGRRVVVDVGFAVAAGESLAIVGPSGSGKSTLLAVLAGLRSPDRGEVELVADGPTALVLQGHGLVGLLTAAENVELALRARGVRGGALTERSAEALTAVGLAPLADRLVGDLSGGQQQRVGVARALVSAPTVLLADEPTSELDGATRDAVLGRLLEVPERGGLLVVATHDPAVAARCSRSLRLVDGRVEAP